ncbi:integrase, catalytic region, zinc finger, CCHC-type containing protein [Tanacetum coccineum]
MNGPYVRRMIPEPGDADREVPVPETFHEQTDDELTEAEIKQMEADDQAIQTILLGLPEDIYAAVVCVKLRRNSGVTCATNDESNGGNQFRQYAGQNVGYQNGYNAVQNVGNQVVQDAVQNQGVQNVGNHNGQIVVPGIPNQNPNGNGNVVAARAEGNATGNNGNQIRCYNCRGLGHLARNCTVRPRRRDAAYLQTQLLIAQKEEENLSQAERVCILMAAAAESDEIEEVNDKLTF